MAEEDAEGDVCLPPDISVDNESHKEYSILTIEVRSQSPALPRGMSLVLQHANDSSGHVEMQVHAYLQVKGYPGMFRVIAWVLNGLMLDVHNATLQTSEDGIVTNKFWLTGEAGLETCIARWSVHNI